VGAICIANALADNGEAELLAVMHNTGIEHGAGAISVLNTYYGRGDVPIGAYKGDFDSFLLGPYVDDLVASFPSPIKNRSQVPDAVALYRETLAKQQNDSVVIASIGFTTNLHPLLQSKPDMHSPLTGIELVAAKVKRLAWMGGAYPASDGTTGEHNFGYNGIGPSTNATLAAWPSTVPIYFSGFELGNPIHTGGIMTTTLPPTNPCRRAYLDHDGWGVDRSSFDPVTVLYAVRGPAVDWATEVYGVNTVLAETGRNFFTNGSAERSHQAYLARRAPVETVAAMINGLLTQPPRHGQ